MMASTTMMASSMTRPIATASPPSDIRLSVWWNSFINTKVAASTSGTAEAATTPARTSLSEIPSTMRHSTTPRRIASRTLAALSSTRVAWS